MEGHVSSAKGKMELLEALGDGSGNDLECSAEWEKVSMQGEKDTQEIGDRAYRTLCFSTSAV